MTKKEQKLFERILSMNNDCVEKTVFIVSITSITLPMK